MIKRPGILGFGRIHGSWICCDIQAWLARDKTISPRVVTGRALGCSAQVNDAGRDDIVNAIAIEAAVLNQPRRVGFV
jgi:hypothetical protein